MDPFLPELTERLSYLNRAGYEAIHLLRSAAAAGPLPDDHPAAALWWRILDQLSETPNQDLTRPDPVPPASRKATRPFNRHRPVPRSAPPPAHGPGR
jgi:hypothetical protein